jgi:hypothetical protein
MTLPWDIPSDLEIAWLLKQGISEPAMITPPVVLAANVVFLDGNTFDFDAGGVRAFIFREPNDLIAWRPASKRVATWRSSAFALGEDAIWNPASYFMGTALRVHRTPFEWLEAERDGICIVQQRFTHALLRHACRLSFADPVYAQQVKRWLQPPKPTVEMLIEVAEAMAA